MTKIKLKKGEFVVHCIMCGKDFRVGDKAECGGLFSGSPMCKTGDIQRALDDRLPKQPPSNGEVRGASRLAGEASSREAATSTDVLGGKENA